MESKDQKRRHKLQEKNKRKAVLAEKVAYYETYPDFVFKNEERADPVFVERVKQIAGSIDFRDLHPTLRNWYAMIKKDRLFLREFVRFGGGVHPKVLAYMFHMGEYIYSEFGETLKSYVPYNDIKVIPEGKHISILFNGLKRAKGSGGTIYHSTFEPKINVEDKEYVVGWSTHALQQTLERIVARPYTYSGAGDAFAFFNQCKYFELTRLHDKTPAFTFYDQCCKGFLSWTYVTQTHGIPRVLNDDGTDGFGDGHSKIDEKQKYYRRIGYCPLVFERGFAKAKTLLPPGYRNTPEARYLYRLTKDKHARYIDLINTPLVNYIKDMMLTLPEDFFEPTVFFHKHIPQVIQTDLQIYERW